MMRFIILGSGPGIPVEDKNLSSIYVHTEELALLLDCGECCSRKLLQLGLSGDHLDAVLISHYHPDHIAGLFMLLQMLYLENRRKALTVFVPEDPRFILDTMHRMYTFESKFAFDLQVKLITQAPLELPGISIAPTDHLQSYSPQIKALNVPNEMRSWAIRISGNHGDLVYSADINSTDCLEDLLDGAHSLIVDALHPNAGQILELHELGLHRVILNHGISPELAALLDSEPLPGFEIAQEDHEYQI